LSHGAQATDRRLLRRELRRERAALPAATRRIAAQKVARHLAARGWLRPGKRIAFYCASGAELSLDAALRIAQIHGCQLFFPRIIHSRNALMTFSPLTGSTRKNRYGIDEPLTRKRQHATRLDLILLPLLGFDRRGTRLGSGAGYYDRALAYRLQGKASRGARLIGVAFACQERTHISATSHDVPLDGIVTPDGIRLFSGEIT